MFLFIKQLLDWVYRSKCYICKSATTEGILCDECYDEIEILSPQPVKAVNNIKIYTVGLYSENLRKLIRAIKYHKKRELASVLAKLFHSQMQNIPLSENSEIIPIPLHKQRLKKRKYNHMEIIANELCSLSGYKVNNDLVERIKDTKPQYKLSKKERRSNLSGAFKVNKENYNGNTLIIIDDISTSGVTIEEMGNELKKNGIENIVAVVLSIPINDKAQEI